MLPRVTTTAEILLLIALQFVVDGNELFLAIRKGDIEEVILHLDAGFHVNEIDVVDPYDPVEEMNGETTPLILALEQRRVDIATLLLERGADANLASPYDDRMPLHVAVQENLPFCAHLLFCKGATATLEEKDDHQLTPFVLAALNENENMMEILLEGGANVDALDMRMCTALHYATMKHNVDVVKMLLSWGASKDLKNDEELTPLLIAVTKGFEYVARVLLEDGADVRVVDSNHETALHLACRHRRPALITLLLEYGCAVMATNVSNATPLHLAAENGMERGILELLAHGGDANAVDVSSESALHFAAYNGERRSVEILLSNGARWDLENARGHPAVIYAISRGFQDVVDVFLRNGADVNYVDSQKYNCAHYAAAEGNASMLTYLMSKGVRLQQLSVPGQTPLLLAIAHGNKRIVRTLVKAGVDVPPDVSRVILREFWPTLYMTAEIWRDLDHTLLHTTEVHLKNPAWNSGNLNDTVETLEKAEVFPLYRILKASYKSGLPSILEGRKFVIFDDILARVVSETYLSKIPLEIVADASFCHDVYSYAWKIEEFSWNSALACNRENVMPEEFEAIKAKFVEKLFAHF